MPLYEYQCEACGQRFEVIRKFSDEPLDACRKCGKGPIQRLQSSPAIQFKGSGWYITDYAKKGSSDSSSAGASKDSKESGTKEAKGDKADSSPAASSGESTKTETKAESKTDSTPAKTESKPAAKDS